MMILTSDRLILTSYGSNPILNGLGKELEGRVIEMHRMSQVRRESFNTDDVIRN